MFWVETGSFCRFLYPCQFFLLWEWLRNTVHISSPAQIMGGHQTLAFFSLCLCDESMAKGLLTIQRDVKVLLPLDPGHMCHKTQTLFK